MRPGLPRKIKNSTTEDTEVHRERRRAMNTTWMIRAIWGAGAVQVGIMAANVPLPGRLRVRERLASVPNFVRQIFYVHWV